MTTDARGHEERITGLAALGVVLCMLPAMVFFSMYPAPQASLSVATIARHFDDHRSAILTVTYLTALGWGGLLLVFAGGLRAILARAEGESTVWATVAFGACLVTAALILVVVTLQGLIAYRAPYIDNAVLSTLYDGVGIANQMTAPPNAVYAMASAVVIYRSDVLPRWLAHLAVLVAVIHLASMPALARTGGASPLGVLAGVAPLSHTAWLAGIALVLLRR